MLTRQRPLAPIISSLWSDSALVRRNSAAIGTGGWTATYSVPPHLCIRVLTIWGASHERLEGRVTVLTRSAARGWASRDVSIAKDKSPAEVHEVGPESRPRFRAGIITAHCPGTAVAGNDAGFVAHLTGRESDNLPTDSSGSYWRGAGPIVTRALAVAVGLAICSARWSTRTSGQTGNPPRRNRRKGFSPCASA